MSTSAEFTHVQCGFREWHSSTPLAEGVSKSWPRNEARSSTLMPFNACASQLCCIKGLLIGYRQMSYYMARQEKWRHFCDLGARQWTFNELLLVWRSSGLEADAVYCSLIRRTISKKGVECAECRDYVAELPVDNSPRDGDVAFPTQPLLLANVLACAAKGSAPFGILRPKLAYGNDLHFVFKHEIN